MGRPAIQPVFCGWGKRLARISKTHAKGRGTISFTNYFQLVQNRSKTMSNVKTELNQSIDSSNGMPIIAVVLVWSAAFMAMVYKITMLDNSGHEHPINFIHFPEVIKAYFDNPLALQELIVVSLTAVIIAPLIHIGIASFWESKRNSRTRRNIVLGWSIVVIFGSLIQIFKL